MIKNIKETKTEEFICSVREKIENSGKRYFVFTFGCQQNEADSERIRAMAEMMGYLPSDTPEGADLIIVNTCAIRKHAEMKALSMLGRFKAIKRQNPELILGVVGCMAAEPHIADMLKNDFHYVSFTAEPNMLHRIPELVNIYLESGKRSFIHGADVGDIVEGVEPKRQEGHRAWVSIMYGCNNFCSYCIVPYVRGRERSRRSSDVISECRSLVMSGVREITLLGQNVNSYRSDITFPELLSEIAEIEGDFIIRFMTSHPKDTSAALIDVMAKYKGKIAPYFHLPLQAGSDSVLRAMNRTYTREKYLSVVKELKEKLPDIAISTDIIVGFPGESEEDFEDTLSVLSSVGFDMVYAFLYSPRAGTRAASMENQVADGVKSERMKRLLLLQDGISLEKNRVYIDRTERVLTDSYEIRDGEIIYTGRTGTSKLVHFRSECAVVGEFVNVKINKAGAFDLFGVDERM